MTRPYKAHEADIEDADVWITKATLMGFEIAMNEAVINPSVWRYTAFMPNHRIVYGLFNADWPGRVAKLAVEAMGDQGHVTS